MDLTARLREVFRGEAEADLAELALAFVQWERELPSPSPAATEAVFRLAHKIKGACRAISFKEGQTLGHLLEYLFRAWHETPREIPAPMVEDVRACHACFQEAVKSHIAGAAVACPAELVDVLNAHLRTLGSSHTIEFAVPVSKPSPAKTDAVFHSSAQPAATSSPRPLDVRLLASFRGEAADLLETLHRHLDDSSAGLDKEAVDSALRAAHTLKGAAAVVRFSATAALAHELEDLLRSMENDGSAPQGGAELPSQVPAARDLLRKINASMEEECPPSASMSASGNNSQQGSAEHGRRENPAAADAIASSHFRIEVERVKKLEESFSDLMVLSPQLDELLESSAAITADFAALSREEEALRHSLGTLLYRAPENREYAKAASYINFTSRQIRAMQRQVSRLESGLRNCLTLLDQRFESVDRNIHGLQLTPAQDVLSGLDAMVRELGVELGKPASLFTHGFDIEMDRSSLQKIRGALIHLLRNCIDHGIEGPAERESLGKSPVARISIVLSLSGGHYKFEVSDDGRGLATREIRRRAIAQSFLSEVDAANLAADDIHRLIFHPRFSTVDKSTHISGRGMGLSSVEQTVRALGGSVGVESRPGLGTAFQILLPAGRAGGTVLLVAANGQHFALPSQVVEKIAPVPAESISFDGDSSHWKSDEGPVPVHHLGSVLGLGSSSMTGSRCNLILLRAGQQRHGLLVEEIIGLRRVVVQDLPPAAAAAGLFGGIIPLAEGRSALLLEAPALVSQGRPAVPVSNREPIVAAASEPGTRPPPTILVVDDSYTSRTLESGVIESMGYRVLQAADGLDGLKVLRNETVDLILCDIEMPRMDGFGMLAEVKKNDRTKDIPFILISSLEDPSIVQKGLSLGADSYIMKRHFEQEQLRDLINHYL